MLGQSYSSLALIIARAHAGASAGTKEREQDALELAGTHRKVRRECPCCIREERP